MKKIFAYSLLAPAFLILALIVYGSASLLPAKYFLADTSGTGPTTYYVAPDGDDTNTGTSTDTPWKSIEKVNSAVLQPGDSVLFKRGGTYYGAIKVINSGLTFGAYDQGAAPVLTGFETLSGWTNVKDNIWEATCTTCASTVGVVTLNNTQQAMGRYPNTGYLNIQSHTGSSKFTDSSLTTDWTGAEAVTRTNYWILDHILIASQNNGTISLGVPATYEFTNGYGYFIQNSPKTLDVPGEWYFNPTSKKLLMVFSGDPAGNVVKASALDSVFNISGNDTTISDLTIEGANTFDVLVQKNVSNLTLQNSTIRFSGYFGIRATGDNNIQIRNNTFSNINSNAIVCNSNCIVSHNTVTNTGTIPGAGGNNNGTYEGIQVKDGAIVDSNTITNTGYIAIDFSGSNIVVKNNVINGFNLVKDDGGGIYTFTGNGAEASNREVVGNTVENGGFPSDGAGGSDHRLSSNGIYIDNNSNDVTISGNTVTNNKGKGIFINDGSHNITIKNNKVFNNNYELYVATVATKDSAPFNIAVEGNIFSSNDPVLAPVRVYAHAETIPLIFSSIKNNFYQSASSNFASFVIDGKNSSIDFPTWQSTYSYDLSSKVVSGALRFEANNTDASKTISLDGTYADASGKTYSGTVQIGAMNGLALIKTADATPIDTTPSTAAGNSGSSGGGGGAPLTTTVTTPVVTSQPFVSLPPVTIPVPPTQNLVVPTVASGFWSFLPFISSTPKPAPVITPAAPALHTNVKTGKKSYDVVSAEYSLNGTVVHTATTYPDDWSLDTATLADGTYTLTSTYHYSDGATDGSTSTFSVDNSPTILERIVGYIQNLLKR